MKRKREMKPSELLALVTVGFNFVNDEKKNMTVRVPGEGCRENVPEHHKEWSFNQTYTLKEFIRLKGAWIRNPTEGLVCFSAKKEKEKERKKKDSRNPTRRLSLIGNGAGGG